MRQSELFPGLICYLGSRDGSVYEGQQMVRVLRPGIPSAYSTRNDASEVVLVDTDEEGKFHDRRWEDNEYNQRWNPKLIGQRHTRVVKNKQLVSLKKGAVQIAEQNREKEERRQRMESMENAKLEMRALIVPYGIEEEHIDVRVRWDSEAKAAQVQSVCIRGESVERMIEVFRDFQKLELDKGEEV